MLWVPQKGVFRRESNMPTVGSTTFGNAVTTGAASTTKGTPVELIASTAFDTYMMEITAEGYAASGAASPGCLDILVGSATESVLISNLLFGGCGNTTLGGLGPKRWLFPVYIPAGTRIAAQAAGNRTSVAFDVAVHLFGGSGYPPFQVGSKVETYGITTVPNGTTVTVGASGAEGSWAQITSSTTRDHFCLVPSWQANDTTTTLASIQVDVGIGAATESLLGSFNYLSTAAEAMEGSFPLLPIFQNIPAGSRLVMRASSSGAADTSNGVIHGVS